jgi:hypothetical protein
MVDSGDNYKDNNNIENTAKKVNASKLLVRV